MAKEQSHLLLQRFMRRYKTFLYQLYKERRGWKNRESLKKTSDNCISVVLRILLCLCLGHIPIRYRHFKTLIKSKRRQMLASLKYKYKSLRNNAAAKREFVLNFASLYCVLFEPLFMPKNEY